MPVFKTGAFNHSATSPQSRILPFYHINFKTRQIQAKKSYQFIGEKLSKDKIYVILDDIRTTGATLNSIAEILLKNGAGEIWAFYLLQQ